VKGSYFAAGVLATKTKIEQALMSDAVEHLVHLPWLCAVA
jgi:hypothetical protein